MSGVEEVVPGIYGILIRLVGIPYVNAFLVDSAEGVAIMDTGMPKRADRSLAGLRDIGRRPAEVHSIVITHHHIDHTGSVRALVSAIGAPVFVHRADAPVVLGTVPSPSANRATLAGWLLGPVIDRLLPRYQPPPGVTEIGDGDVLPFAGGALVVHTPGHTPGHVSLLLGSKRLLIVGDAASSFRGDAGAPIGMYTEDMAMARRSIERLAGLEFDTACFGHGAALHGRANAAFRSLVERLASAA